VFGEVGMGLGLLALALLAFLWIARSFQTYAPGPQPVRSPEMVPGER
jgi:hypothetical protein